MVTARGYTGGPDHFRHRIAQLRPRRPREAYLRLRTLAGEQAQVDWAHFGKLTIGRAERPLMAFVLVLSYSRYPFVRFYLGASLANLTRVWSISSSLVRSKLSKKDSMSASRIQLTLPWYTARFSARIASWAPRPGRNPYEHSRKSCSYTASSTSRTASWTILSSTADIPIGRVRPPPLGMCTHLSG